MDWNLEVSCELCGWQVRDQGLGWKRRYVTHEERLGTEVPEKKDPKAKMGLWAVSQQLRAKAAQTTGGGNQTDNGTLAAPESPAGAEAVSERAQRDDMLEKCRLIKDEQPKTPEHISRTRKREIAALAAAGNVSACFELALCYTYGMGGLERNPREALQWYEQAADLGHVDAMYRAGVCFLDGFGAPANNRTALRFFSNAGAAGHVHANINLGLMFLKGGAGGANTTRPCSLYCVSVAVQSFGCSVSGAGYGAGLMFPEGDAGGARPCFL